MILLIDVGNTRAKYCIHSHEQFSDFGYINLAEITQRYLTTNFANFEQVIVASVKQAGATDVIRQWCTNEDIAFTEVSTQAKAFGVINSYSQPERLGVDRWLALVGAAKNFPNSNTLIIDTGTATTCDLLLDNGQHAGGWILPGIDALYSSILNSTDNVEANKTQSASLSFGKNTTECVNNASWAATVGVVESAIKEARQHCLLEHVLLLGGNADKLASLLDFSTIRTQNLIFDGLLRYAKRQ